MKQLKNKFLIPGLVLIAVMIGAACKKYLDKGPIGTLSPQVMQSEKGVQGLLIGAYSLVDGEGAAGDGFASGASNWILGGVASDEAYKGSDPTDVGEAAPMEQWTSLTSTNGAIPQKWIVLYAGIQRSNDVLNTLAATPGISATKVSQIQAQARFLRAFYHFELRKVFGKVAWVDETVGITNTKISNSTEIYPNIEADLTFAIANLPDDWKATNEVGRANKSAAKAMLAKVYMFQKKYSAALPILTDLIANGKTAHGDAYGLNDHFYSNFNPAQKNSKESVFAAQTSVLDNSSVDWGGDPNGNYGDILNFPYTGGPGACCGFYNPSQDLANAFKTDANGLPLLDTYFQGASVSDQFNTPYAGNLDPRIDWTMGRPGIPYLDWGNHPGLAWIRNPANDGNKSPIKNVYAQSQKNFTDIGSAYWGPTELVANNVNIIRFSDILLWEAECKADAGDLAGALVDVNKVRSRMKDHPEAWVKAGGTYDAANSVFTGGSGNADTYNIGLYASFADKATAVKAIQMERRLELAMEGHRFFDLVRWGIAATTINAFIQREKSFRPLKANAVFTAGKNEYMPIPQAEIDKMNSDGTVRLVQNPGY